MTHSLLLLMRGEVNRWGCGWGGCLWGQ